jgi:glycosyltransferase involved in cell wall biosynthesis
LEKEKIKILFVYHEDLSKQELGSIGTYILEIIRYVSETKEYSYSYIGPTPCGSYPECLSSQSYLPYSPRKSGKRKWIPETLRIMRELYIHRHSSDNSMVSVHRWEQAIPFFFNKNRGPVILTIHGSGKFTSIAYHDQFGLFLFHKLMERWALRYVDKIILISRDAFDHYQKKFPQWSAKYIYIPTFVSEKSFFPISREVALKQLGIAVSNSPIFLYVGRLVPEKNIPIMIDLMEQYCQTVSPAQFWIVGDGTEKKNLETIVKQKKLSKEVVFWGGVSHDRLVYIYNSADILFLLSNFEGTPLTLLESLACGTPCLATPVGDLPFIIQEDINGFVVNKNNMKTMLEKLILMVKEETRFREQAVHSATKFQAQNIIPEIIQCYRQVWQEWER